MEKLNTGSYEGDPTAERMKEATDKINRNFDLIFNEIGLRQFKLKWEEQGNRFTGIGNNSFEVFSGVSKRFDFIEGIIAHKED